MTDTQRERLGALVLDVGLRRLEHRLAIARGERIPVPDVTAELAQMRRLIDRPSRLMRDLA